MHLDAKKHDRHERPNELLDKQLFHHRNLSDLELNDGRIEPSVALSLPIAANEDTSARASELCQE